MHLQRLALMLSKGHRRAVYPASTMESFKDPLAATGISGRVAHFPHQIVLLEDCMAFDLWEEKKKMAVEEYGAKTESSNDRGVASRHVLAFSWPKFCIGKEQRARVC